MYRIIGLFWLQIIMTSNALGSFQWPMHSVPNEHCGSHCWRPPSVPGESARQWIPTALVDRSNPSPQLWPMSSPWSWEGRRDSQRIFLARHIGRLAKQRISQHVEETVQSTDCWLWDSAKKTVSKFFCSAMLASNFSLYSGAAACITRRNSRSLSNRPKILFRSISTDNPGALWSLCSSTLMACSSSEKMSQHIPTEF